MTTVNLTYCHRELLMRFVVMTIRDIEQAKRIAGVLLDVPFTNADDAAPVDLAEADITTILDVLYDDDGDLDELMTDKQRRDFLTLMQLVDDANSGAGGEL